MVEGTIFVKHSVVVAVCCRGCISVALAGQGRYYRKAQE